MIKLVNESWWLEMSKVSIVLPIYDVESFIGSCLSTLVNQTYTNLEIICVIDGSLDNSIDVCRAYQEKYPNMISIYEKENGGLSDARNYGYLKATGEYVIFIDSDDYVNHDYIQLLTEALDNSDADMAFSDVDLVYPTYKRELLLVDRYMKMNQNDIFVALYPSAWNKLYRKEFLDKHHFTFKKGLKYEDVNFLYKVLLHKPQIVFVENAIYYYRQRQNSMIKVVDSSVDDMLFGLEDILDYAKAHDLYQEYYVELEYVCINYALATYMKLSSKLQNSAMRKQNIEKAFTLLETHFAGYKNNVYLQRKSNRNLYLKHVSRLTMPFVLKILKNNE